MFNPLMGNIAPTCMPFLTQFGASRPDSVGVGGSSNPSPQTPIRFSPNLQYSEFANTRGLDAIDLNKDEIENPRQERTQHWHWEEDEMLISVWLRMAREREIEMDMQILKADTSTMSENG
ncbi:hypothetical protein PIB30_043628 [Stylosanthes scabra]|uniref:Uncharacterized protein n=1 Tax=Stylosanthes scabra TaxID=79078 RepID=A0ABU6VF53_9FABA|nr:hypothetical protein [Stylosanthes scabra]